MRPLKWPLGVKWLTDFEHKISKLAKNIITKKKLNPSGYNILKFKIFICAGEGEIL